MATPADPAAAMEELAARHKALEEKKIRTDQNLRHSLQQLEDLKRQAREAYGTDDLDALRAQLAAMKEENERLVREYAQHLQGIESQLAEIEKNQANTPAEPSA